MQTSEETVQITRVRRRAPRTQFQKLRGLVGDAGRVVMPNPERQRPRVISALLGWLSLGCVMLAANLRADETCSSPYLARIEGQEEFVYVWTLGAEGVGDGSDKLVTVDVKPGSPAYGKVINSHSIGSRNEAHHGGFTDDR